MESPIVHIYAMTDETTQEHARDILDGFDGLTVQVTTSGPDHFILVECPDEVRARAVFGLVMSIDSTAMLTDSQAGSLLRRRSALFGTKR